MCARGWLDGFFGGQRAAQRGSPERPERRRGVVPPARHVNNTLTVILIVIPRACLSRWLRRNTLPVQRTRRSEVPTRHGGIFFTITATFTAAPQQSAHVLREADAPKRTAPVL